MGQTLACMSVWTQLSSSSRLVQGTVNGVYLQIVQSGSTPTIATERSEGVRLDATLLIAISPQSLHIKDLKAFWGLHTWPSPHVRYAQGVAIWSPKNKAFALYTDVLDGETRKLPPEGAVIWIRPKLPSVLDVTQQGEPEEFGANVVATGQYVHHIKKRTKGHH